MASVYEVRVSKVPEGQEEFTSTYKVLMIGDTSVGKTALLNRFTDGSFHSSFVSTVGKCLASYIDLLTLSGLCICVSRY